MISTIIHSIATTYTGNLPLINVLLSIIPFLGTKVAIPYTTNVDAWGAIALQPLQAFAFSFLANVGLIIVLCIVIHPIIKLIKKTRLYLTITINHTSKKTKYPMPQLERATIIAIIKSIPLVGSYLSVFIGAFYLNIWSNILANTAGAIVCAMISTLIGINNSCRLIVLIVIILEMLAIAIITIVHTIKNTPPFRKRRSKLKSSSQI